MNTSPYTDLYWQYLQAACPSIASGSLPFIRTALETTNWDDPQTPSDWNNYGVLALIEAEQATDVDLRRLYVETAIAAFDSGANDHPLCAAHLALAYSLIGETDRASEIAAISFIRVLQPLCAAAVTAPAGLIYLPTQAYKAEGQAELASIVQLGNSLQQALFLLSAILGQQLLPVFYSQGGLRLLNLATKVLPESAVSSLTLGIASLMNSLWEGLFYLHHAEQLAPNAADGLQALYLAYRDLNDLPTANYWLETARARCPLTPHNSAWRWTEAAIDHTLTCLPFNDLLLTVKPSLLSITTGVLLAKGDWFEAEMEFWRTQIQPGMTVIDVGANVGVYTFSAAQRVGNQGRVLAIEPFSDCVRCLQETCKVNQLSWVNVIAGAASDRNHTARLALQSASELNRLVTNDAELINADNIEAVACFTLDTLLEQNAIDHVDFLKIDAEGHEMQVLAGSEQLLTNLMPTIIYENIAGVDEANTSVATFLQAKGYQLFRYQPYLQTLVPVDKLDDLQMSLNIIAMHSSKL